MAQVVVHLPIFYLLDIVQHPQVHQSQNYHQVNNSGKFYIILQMFDNGSQIINNKLQRLL